MVDMWIPYRYSLYFSDQFSCINFFDLSYGLKDIEFQRFKHFKSFKIPFNNFLYYFSNIIQNSADMWDPHVSLCLFIKPLIKSEKPLDPHVIHWKFLLIHLNNKLTGGAQVSLTPVLTKPD